MKQLIDKSDLIAEIERLYKLEYIKSDNISICKKMILRHILSFLDTLETKDTNLEKELETLDSLLYDLDGVAVKGTSSYLTVEDVKDIAKSFFELGLKTQKGE